MGAVEAFWAAGAAVVSAVEAFWADPRSAAAAAPRGAGVVARRAVGPQVVQERYLGEAVVAEP